MFNSVIMCSSVQISNALLLILSVFFLYGGVIAFFCLFKETGLYVWTALAAIAANIEVLIVVRAFGMEQTLGNVVFASSFLVTDILSELYGRKSAGRAVWIGVAVSLAFIVISQSWLLYTPAESDWAMPSVRALFSNTPRVMGASLLTYAVAELFDVWAYHAWWGMTERKSGSRRAFLWLRNNGSTLISQGINTVLFNFLAFAGTFDTSTLLSIMASGYVIFVVTSLADTPFVYIARRIGQSSQHHFPFL